MTYDLKKLKAKFDKGLDDTFAEDVLSGKLIDISDLSEEDLKGASFDEEGKLQLENGKRPKMDSRKVKVLKNTVAANKSSRLRLEDFEKRGFEYGTIEQSWEALESLAKSIELGLPPHPAAGLWLLNALNKTKTHDPQDLLRNLGLVARGRSKVVNKFDVSDRMAELIDGGMVKEHAAQQVAKEFSCSRATALHWYRKRNELYDN